MGITIENGKNYKDSRLNYGGFSLKQISLEDYAETQGSLYFYDLDVGDDQQCT